MCAADLLPARPAVREGYIPVHQTELFHREIGKGRPIFILHGGPDFNHNYLLPDLDRLSDSFRLIYYDQRGRGKSAGSIQPDEVSIESEIEDLEALREYYQLESVAILGHSWGGLLAMEYAVRYPQRVSHLVLLNPGPASHNDYLLLRQERRKTAAADIEELSRLSSSARYQEGDLEADAAYYRIHFRTTLRRPEHLDRVVKSLRVDFTPEGILKARAIEDRLMDETWLSSEYNLFPMLAQLDTPSFIIHSEHDLIPLECAAHIAQAIPGARFIVLKETGHFSYLEHPKEVCKLIFDFFHRS